MPRPGACGGFKRLPMVSVEYSYMWHYGVAVLATGLLSVAGAGYPSLVVLGPATVKTVAGLFFFEAVQKVLARPEEHLDNLFMDAAIGAAGMKGATK